MVKKTAIAGLTGLSSGASPKPLYSRSGIQNIPIRLSIINQFYPPDFAATGQLIEELAKNLHDQGIPVHVFTGQPGYAFSKTAAPLLESRGRSWVHRSRSVQLFNGRLRGKALNGVLFVLRTALHLLKAHNRGDVLLLTTAPPFSLILGWVMNVLFKTPYICLLYDLYPDAAVELKVVSKTNLVVKVWDFVNRCVWQRAARIIVLSSTMQDRVVAKCPAVADQIAIIHSWADPKRIKPLAKADNWFAQQHGLTHKFTVLYSGNMGRCHDLDTIMNAAYELRDEPIEFVFIGSGAKRKMCLERVQELGLTHCQFLPYQEKSSLPYSLTACDLSLVSVSAGVEGIVAPSKLYSALAAGRPIAAICESHSYLRPLIAEAGCGATFDNGDSAGLADFIRQLAAAPHQVQSMGQAGRDYMEHHFTPEQIAQQYADVVQQVAAANLVPSGYPRTGGTWVEGDRHAIAATPALPLPKAIQVPNHRL